MKLYNSESNQMEALQPQSPDAPISIYTCGITPYDTTHLGHAFTYATTDLLIRYLTYQGYTVRYVQNVTDIDDDILRKAAEVDEDWRELGNRWTRHFIKDLQQLNLRAPDEFPRATDVIPEIIEHVTSLIERGVAYVEAGNVYFAVDDWSRFGELSDLPREEMLAVANQHGNNPDDPHKRDPLDFVLWQAQQPGEPAWESPWGMGRPGWHIECSTMSTLLLGKTVDIHIGGADLLFPHHECEIAQVTPLTGESFVHYWLHVAMVQKDGEKMSKSLGNLVMARDLLKTYSPNAIRLYLAQHHYRTPWSYNEDQLQEAATLVETIANALDVQTDAVNTANELDATTAKSAFEQAMDQDLDSPGALSALEQLAHVIIEAGQQGKSLSAAQDQLRTMAEVFGLYFTEQAPSAPAWEPHLARFS